MTQITASNSSNYKSPAAIASDPVIFAVADADEGGRGVLQVLLVERHEAPFQGALVLPGGFVGDSESPEETAARKLAEKTGIDAGYLEQLRTYGDPRRDPRGWIPSVAYLALIPRANLAGEGQAEWIAVEDLAEHRDRIGFDHVEIVDDAHERLRGKLWYSNVAVGLLPREFTIGEARKIYEAILGEGLDPGNFARDLKASGLVETTDKVRSTGHGRPGKALRFVSREPAWSPTRVKGRKR